MSLYLQRRFALARDKRRAMKSRVNREVQARFCEGLGVKSPGATRQLREKTGDFLPEWILSISRRVAGVYSTRNDWVPHVSPFGEMGFENPWRWIHIGHSNPRSESPDLGHQILLGQQVLGHPPDLRIEGCALPPFRQEHAEGWGPNSLAGNGWPAHKR